MSTFIHYSHDNKIYKDKDFDSVGRTGIEIKGKNQYTANTLTQYKDYKTLRGAENFMKKSGRHAIAVENGKSLIFLTSKAEKVNKNYRRTR